MRLPPATMISWITVGLAAAEIPPSADDVSVRKVRVLVASRVNTCRIRSGNERALRVVAAGSTRLAAIPSPDWVEVRPHRSSGFRLGAIREGADHIQVQNITGGPIELLIGKDDRAGQMLPGVVHIHRRRDGTMDLINELDVEKYVACVVAAEAWPTFHREALRAQAIAARTFVLYQMRRRTNRPYDIGSTQSAQVYRGLRSGSAFDRARQAADDTEGLVLTYETGGAPEIFCAYYSAACGGSSQSAAIFGSEDAIRPLAGNVACDYCKIAPGDTYRWGPVSMTLRKVRSRLARAYPKLARAGAVKSVRITERTEDGRALQIQVRYTEGKPVEFLAERFRLALDGSLIKSTAFDLVVADGKLIFRNGQGFGHGLGLCQWGAQGQAVRGRRAGDILDHYYPGSRVTRVY